jgi:hypothetical protein
MPIYKGTFTNKSGTKAIEMFNNFYNFSFSLDVFSFSGNDLDGLALVNPEENELLASSYFDFEKIKIYESEKHELEIRNYILKLQIPQILIEVSTKKEIEVLMDFQLVLKENFEEAKVTFEIDGQHYEGKNGLLEIILDQIQKKFKGKYRFKNCYGCLYGDYSVYGQGFMSSILCFKNQKKAYLQVDTKAEYMKLKIHDSQQQELFCCKEYEIRDRNVGYRGTVI